MSRRQDAKGVTALITLFIVLVLAAVALPFIGGRNMVRGYNRTPIETAFLTVFANAALIVGGAFVGAFALGIFIQNSSATANSAPDYVSGAGLSILSSIIGAIWGYSLRAQRLEAIAVARDNATFLSVNGFREAGSVDVTYYDANNNPLRYMETLGNSQVYMAVGRRNKRAYIELDASGRMTSYSGIVSL